MHSIVYSALNHGVHPDDRKQFRKDWLDRGPEFLVQLLLRCTSPDWAAYPETFWVNPTFAPHFRVRNENGIYYFIYEWLDDKPLPPYISPDWTEEDRKVQELRKLFSALNR